MHVFFSVLDEWLYNTLVAAVIEFFLSLVG